MVDAELAKAHTLPSEFYWDPAILSVERERLFWNSWQWVGHSDQLREPGDYLAVDIAGEPVVLLKGHDSVVRAFSNVCRHRGTVIAEGCGRGLRSLQCPYHAWTYSFKGELTGAPEFEGVENWEKNAVRLPEYAVESWGPLLLVHLGKEPLAWNPLLENIPSEMATQGYRLENYEFLTRREYTIECNWKVYVDNYLEGYHLPTIHPALFRELDYKNYRVDTYGLYSSQYAPLRTPNPQNPAGRRYRENDPMPLYYWIFPNLMLNFYPDNMSANWVIPLGPDRTLTVFEWFVEKGKRPDLESTIAFSDQVQQEDVIICERVQRGLQSRSYQQGRYSVTRENGLHHFHRLWQKWVKEEK